MRAFIKFDYALNESDTVSRACWKRGLTRIHDNAIIMADRRRRRQKIANSDSECSEDEHVIAARREQKVSL